MLNLEFDEPQENARCYDCGDEVFVEETYVLLDDGTLAPLCVECVVRRKTIDTSWPRFGSMIYS